MSIYSARIIVTSSVRGLSHTATSYADAQDAARKLAEAEANYLAGTPYWHSIMRVERMHNDDGNCTGYRVLRLPTGPLAAHIAPTEVVATADIAADFAAIQAEREAEIRRIQIEQVRLWMAEGIEVPENYPVQPSDLEENAPAHSAPAHSARYSTRLNTDDRCHEVYDTQAAIGADPVVSAFYWCDGGNPGIEAVALMDELNYADAKRAGEEAEDAECTINCPGCKYCEMGEHPYCEMCGDPAELVGEQWVCRGCSPVCDSLYCEACGREIDPADAVLSNDEMVCCDCADKREVADEGLRLSGEDQPGWTMRLRSGAVVWVTDEPVKAPAWPCEIRGGMVVRRVNWGS